MPAAVLRPLRALRPLRTFQSLGTRNYRLFATGQVVSNTGTWMQRVAQDWLVLELTDGSGIALGIATGLQFLPLLLFSLWGGMIADRYPKRAILMATQAAMGALALILGVLALTGVVTVWQVYLLAFALGMVTVVDNPTRQTFVVEMVGRDGMANAIALNSAVFNLARITGPAVAGLVIAAVGTPAAFMVNAASYGAVLIGLKLMRPAELHPLERAPRARGQLREALAYVRARPEPVADSGACLLRRHVRHELPGDDRPDVAAASSTPAPGRSVWHRRSSRSARSAARCWRPAAPGPACGCWSPPRWRSACWRS